jgi:hypothetical protein
MNRLLQRLAAVLAFAAVIAPVAAAQDGTNAAPPAPHLLDHFKALAGHWAADGLDGNSAPDMKLSYEVTAGGTAVVETLFAGTPHEMRSVYTQDGSDVVMTHYCASGNHPRMRARAMQGKALAFEFDGATNFDPATAGHMHEARFEFVGADELRAQWISWKDGKPGEHVARLHVARVTQ